MKKPMHFVLSAILLASFNVAAQTKETTSLQSQPTTTTTTGISGTTAQGTIGSVGTSSFKLTSGGAVAYTSTTKIKRADGTAATAKDLVVGKNIKAVGSGKIFTATEITIQ